MIHVDPPFDLGETLLGTDDDSNLINTHWEGAIYSFPDVDRSVGPRGSRTRRSGAAIRAVCVRNTSGGALTVAKKALKFDLTPGATTGRKLLGSVDAQSSAVNQFGGVGDNELTTTVASNDLFWMIVGGPAEVLFKDSANISIGDLLITSSSAGAADEAAAGSATVGMTAAVNILGRALEADSSTSSATLLIQVAVNI
jgi:hypothetical protein